MEIGDPVVVIDAVENGERVNEHAGLVTRVWSETEINCVAFIDSPMVNMMMFEHLHRHDATRRITGPRFRLKGEAV